MDASLGAEFIRRQISAMSPCTAISVGMTSSTSRVVAINPNTSVIAIGIRNCAWKLLSNSKGVNPPIVVSDVRITARKRSQVPSTIAWK